MDVSDIQMVMAEQIIEQKPARFEPRVNLIFMPGESSNSLMVEKNDTDGKTIFVVEYNEGWDNYSVTTLVWPGKIAGEETRCSDMVYCDMLGEILFGDEAVPMQGPLVEIITWDEDGNEKREGFGGNAA